MPFTPEPENPFTTPMASVVSLNTPDDSAIMTESTSSAANELSDSVTTPTAAAPGDSSPRSHPPPQPLDLPKPRTPPPRNGTPHADRPPEPIAAPNVNAGVREEEASDKRWWTDWLCGCRQDGDHQVRKHVRRVQMILRDLKTFLIRCRLLGRTHLNNHFSFVSTCCVLHACCAFMLVDIRCILIITDLLSRHLLRTSFSCGLKQTQCVRILVEYLFIPLDHLIIMVHVCC